jgi:hypothetical protein
MPGPSRVSDCQPCSFRVAPQGEEFAFFFNVRPESDGGRIIESIRVSHGSKPLQELKVHGMMPVREGERFFFGGTDINFDGFLDLELITRSGVANAYADYWLFAPASNSFAYLGNFPILKVNAETHRLSSNERGGYGGMIYEAREYAFVDGKLEVMRCEKQEATKRENVFRKTIRERVNGKLRQVHTELVPAK